MNTLLLSLALVAAAPEADEAPSYAAAMRRVAANFAGREGVVLHVGDSITYANPYGQWARFGQGRTDDDRALLRWMHAGADDDSDGWWLARVDRPGGRSDTAASGLRADELLAGGRAGLPSLADMLKKYRPRLVVLLIGTNDCSAGRPVDDYRRDMARALDQIVAAGAIPLPTTIPPHPGRTALAKQYNEALRGLAQQREVPLVDYEAEILRRRPDDWNGTLLGKNDVHPSANFGGSTPASPPTPEHLANSGYLLRCWLTVQTLGEVKRWTLP